jgi:hypothetical protein
MLGDSRAVAEQLHEWFGSIMGYNNRKDLAWLGYLVGPLVIASGPSQ